MGAGRGQGRASEGAGLGGDPGAQAGGVVGGEAGYRTREKGGWCQNYTVRGAAAGTPKAAAKKAAVAGAVSIDDLLAAKKAVVAMGGSDRAVEAIQALKRLEG